MSTYSRRPAAKKASYRVSKGNNLTTLPSNYTVVDVETTGSSSRAGEVIEIGAVKVVDDEVVDTFQAFLRPRGRIPGMITALTGITDEMVRDAKPRQQVLYEFLLFADDDVLIGHNVNFDVNFLYDECKKHLGVPLRNDFVDTLRLSRRLFRDSGMRNHRLDSLALHCGVNIPSHLRHRALGDADATQQCYAFIKRTYPDGLATKRSLQ